MYEERNCIPGNCELIGGETKNYVSLTANTFKERFSGHLFKSNHKNSGNSKTKTKSFISLGKFYNMPNHLHQKTDNVHFAQQRKKSTFMNQNQPL